MRIPKTKPFAYFRWTDEPAGSMLSAGNEKWTVAVKDLFRRARRVLGDPDTQKGKRSLSRESRTQAWLKIGFGDMVADWRVSDSAKLTELSRWWSGRWESYDKPRPRKGGTPK